MLREVRGTRWSVYLTIRLHHTWKRGGQEIKWKRGPPYPCRAHRCPRVLEGFWYLEHKVRAQVRDDPSFRLFKIGKLVKFARCSRRSWNLEIGGFGYLPLLWVDYSSKRISRLESSLGWNDCLKTEQILWKVCQVRKWAFRRPTPETTSSTRRKRILRQIRKFESRSHSSQR